MVAQVALGGRDVLLDLGTGQHQRRGAVGLNGTGQRTQTGCGFSNFNGTIYTLHTDYCMVQAHLSATTYALNIYTVPECDL